MGPESGKAEHESNLAFASRLITGLTIAIAILAFSFAGVKGERTVRLIATTVLGGLLFPLVTRLVGGLLVIGRRVLAAVHRSPRGPRGSDRGRR